MATTGAVLYVRPRMDAASVANRTTSAVMAVVLRTLSGIFSSGSMFDNASAQSLKAWLPPPRVPVTNPTTGLMTPEWYRFFRYIVEDRLGGASAPSIADVQSTVGSVQQAVTSNSAAVALVTDAVNANAQSLQTTIQVSQINALAGAAQIPDPVQAPRYTNRAEY